MLLIPLNKDSSTINSAILLTMKLKGSKLTKQNKTHCMVKHCQVKSLQVKVRSSPVRSGQEKSSTFQGWSVGWFLML